MRANYWSNSRIADWIRGTIKPDALELGEWNKWNTNAKTKYPIRYWIAEELLDKIQDIIFYIPDKINDIRVYINNRFHAKTHTLTSTLEKGRWHEFDDRLLYCMFDEFINFIEVEAAWNFVVWDDDRRQKYVVPWYHHHRWLRWFSEWRCPEAALEWLDIQSKFTVGEWVGEDHPDYGKPSAQALSAIEQKELYNWWKNIRPNRPDPYEVSGWSEYCDTNRELYDGNLFFEKTEEEKKQTKHMLDILHNMEESYNEEDEQMMIRLIRLRRSLWT